MSFPSTKSKFKGACKKCKVQYEQGATIYKINEDYWCSNQNCPGVEASTAPKTEFSPLDLEAKLDQIWDICLRKAEQIMALHFSKEILPDNFERRKQTLIIAQTFVKALCGND